LIYSFQIASAVGLENSELTVHIIIFPQTMLGASLITKLGFNAVLTYLGAVFFMLLVGEEALNTDFYISG
jgi:hypothetical protein